jgi:GrpB-like predicted nucleotidyltransferase (UPF0157 family)
MAPVPIQVVPYDPSWPRRFARVRADLERALIGVPTIAIEHVGSTSVPGLAAKPVIDVDVVVSRDELRSALDALEAVGYRHRGDLGIPDRHSLHAPDDGVRRNVYVVVDGALALRNHLAIRAALRADDRLRAQYGTLKRRLAAEVDDIDIYVLQKTELLVRILSEAGFTPAEIDAVRAANQPRA